MTKMLVLLALLFVGKIVTEILPWTIVWERYHAKAPGLILAATVSIALSCVLGAIVIFQVANPYFAGKQ